MVPLRLDLRNSKKLPPGARAHDSRPDYIYHSLPPPQQRDIQTPIHAQPAQWHTPPRPQQNELRLAQLPARRLPTPPKMHVSRLLFFVTHVLVATVNANVEKAVFLGPRPVALAVVPDGPPSLDALRLDTLLPVQGSSIVATQLPVQFPSVPAPRGYDAWYLLRGLQEGRRYEVRICWPATVSVPSFPSLLMARCSLSLMPSPCLCATTSTDLHPATHRLLAAHV